LGVLDGVIRTRVGYTGGSKADPTYYFLGDHTEAVQIDFDPTVISYADLLTVFFEGHDCSILVGSRQYMSAIFFHDAEQEEQARQAKALEEERLGVTVQTQVLPVGTFYLAEDYHQKYYLQGDNALMWEFWAFYPGWWDIVDSTVATRVNGYLGGYGTKEQLLREIDSYGLSEEGKDRLLSLVG
jgi:methionine-S-sulfoxide reductase